ncbi:MAG TPA: dihydropteroate synthase [Nitrospira sp.]|nr:dihydropteroate synthase [Nitrospira sp.]
MELRAKERIITLSARPLIMGIVNVTPDSFFDGGRFLDPEAAVAHALRLVQEGSDLLDIGAESTRPGSVPVEEAEERRRLIPVVAAVAKAVSVPISVDTSKAVVAKAAFDAGAVIVNDVTALRGDPAMVDLIAMSGAGVVLMHMQGTPQTMQLAPRYHNVVEEVGDFLVERVRFAMERGVRKGQIMLDPGIGFGKTLEHNLDLLAQLRTFTKLGLPLLVGPSRKAFIGQLVEHSMQDRAWGTAGVIALAVEQGANVLRVHDVAAMKDVVRVAAAISRRISSPLREQHA